jgi:hypothetical protein
MRVLFYLGWILLAAAFLSAAAEMIVRLYPSEISVLTSAYDLWYTIWPGGLTLTQIRIERVSPMLWDPVLITVLTLPAWVLFGLPGLLITWYCRPGRVMTPSELQEHREHIEALMLYDELTEESKRAGYTDDSDDLMPDHEGFEVFQALDETPDRGVMQSDEEIFEAILAAHKSASEPPKSN